MKIMYVLDLQDISDIIKDYFKMVMSENNVTIDYQFTRDNLDNLKVSAMVEIGKISVSEVTKNAL